ncbi:MAG: Spi family protease inhibitor [Draconibacterium sp.]
MKKLIILSFLLLAIEILFAEPIDKETAQKVATNFMNNKRGVENEVKNIISEDYNQFTCYYVINFKSGGWAMVSSIQAAVPVLCYSLNGEYKTDDEKPDAFVALTDEYKKKIEKSKSKKSEDKQLQKKWEKLLNGSSLKSVTYSPGNRLLDVPNRGHVQWRQSSNNSGGCSPSYNSYCISASCDCGHKPTGCGAVAMGQIMWYWKWPLQSTIRAYNWNIMPNILTNSSSTEEGNAIAQLLDDCGDAADKSYIGCNTFTMVNDIEDAFKGNLRFSIGKVVLYSKVQEPFPVIQQPYGTVPASIM